MGWANLQHYLAALEEAGELLRISRPVDVELEAGCIADRLVKSDGKAVLFEQPRLPDGSISEFPLAMNLFGSSERVNLALGVKDSSEIGERLVGMMKPDVKAISKNPFKGISLALDGLRMAPKRVKKGACQEVVIDDPDLTKLPIPKTWPKDGGPFITLPLVVTKDPTNGEHNLGMYRSQIFGPKECGLHWQMHKHAADHAAAGNLDGAKIPVAICIGGPPELIFSAIAPLPDNLSEYMFTSFLSKKRLKLVKAKTQDIWIPAEADIVIEGYCVPQETRVEGPFGDHFGLYSLAGDYPVLHVTSVTHREGAVAPMTIVGLPPMEDGFLGNAITDAFLPVLNFQHRDVLNMHVPLETGFHNLAIVATKQRYPRQGRKAVLGLLGAGQLMFTKISVVADAAHPVKNMESLLDILHSKVDPKSDLIVIPGMVADTLEAASPWENVHDKLLIDAATFANADPRKGGSGLPRGTSFDPTPNWRRGLEEAPGVDVDFTAKVRALDGIVEASLLRPSILVVTTKIDGT
ncbi:MAG: UbiD family decarboxylase, partial [Euryarchaeota archaeon]|nr:UbiD family decarboxylase [Euryarchaeota archaeon]